MLLGQVKNHFGLNFMLSPLPNSHRESLLGMAVVEVSPVTIRFQVDQTTSVGMLDGNPSTLFEHETPVPRDFSEKVAAN